MHHRSPGLPNCFKSSQLQQDYCCPRVTETSCIPHICWGTDTRGTWLAVPYLKALRAAQGKHTMTKHAVKLPLIHPPSFSTATSLCVLS